MTRWSFLLAFWKLDAPPSISERKKIDFTTARQLYGKRTIRNPFMGIETSVSYFPCRIHSGERFPLE
jgi:hypothetical protein